MREATVSWRAAATMTSTCSPSGTSARGSRGAKSRTTSSMGKGMYRSASQRTASSISLGGILGTCRVRRITLGLGTAETT
jgi:hypothetical protein